MIDFGDEFNNDDPLSNTEMFGGALNTPYAAVFLVLGNLAGIAPFVYHLKIGSYVVGWVAMISLVVSFFYHLCQTSMECFLYTILDWVANDHFTSTWYLATLLLSFFNVRTRCDYLSDGRLLTEACVDGSHRSTPLLLLVQASPTETESKKIVPIRRQRRTHTLEENLIYDHWSAGSFTALTVITYLAVRAHPFSYAAFVIVITSCILAAFLKIMLLDEGEPTNFRGRFSLPELLISLALSIVGLVAYVLDSYVEYLVLHSLWHVAIYIATMFFEAGTKKSVNGWIPLWRPIKHWFQRHYYY